MTREELIEAIINQGVVTRHQVQDGLFSLADLQGDPAWEHDPVTDNWFKRTPEYRAARGLAEAELSSRQQFAEIALLAAIIELERCLPFSCMGPSGPLAPDGACYVEIASFDRGAFCHHTVEEAISVWRQRLLDYVSANPGDVLWWRDRPEIQGNVPFGSTRLHWLVYSRLRIGYDGKVDRNVAEMLADNVFGSAEQPVQKIRMVER